MNIYKSRNVKTPSRGTAQSAGIDIFLPEDLNYTRHSEYTQQHIEKPEEVGFVSIYPGESILVPMGIHVNVPAGHALIVFNKSGIAAKRNLVVGACVIDEDYTGEIHLDLKNVGSTGQILQAGDKITQLLCVPINYVEVNVVNSLDECYLNKESDRGTGGFGSTGNK